MKPLGKILVTLGASLGVLIAILAIRAVTWKPETAGPRVALAAARAIDVDAAAAHLGEAVRFRTVSNQDPAANAWAEWDRLHAWMQAAYPKAHAAMERRELGRTLIYRWAGSDPALEPIVLMAHQDVVPVEEATAGRWTQAPFSGAVAGGFVWGRGAMDDKGSLVSILEAVETLAGSGFKPRRTVYLVFGHDEEVAGTGAAAAAAWFKASRITPEFALDEGSLALSNNPITGSPVALIATAEKGSSNLLITAEGAGGHSSTPPRETAALTVARAVDRIASRPFPLRFQGPGAETVKAVAADGPAPMRALVANSWLFAPLIAAKMGETPTAAALLHTTIAPTMLQGSPKANVLPQRASAVINYRIAPGDTPDSVIARARAAVTGLPVKLSWIGTPAGATAVSSTRSRGWGLVASLAREQTGAPAAPSLSVAATDGRSFSGVARDVYRFEPILVSEQELSGFHGINERLSLINLKRMIGFYERLIESAAS